jgi:glutathione S-transferase
MNSSADLHLLIANKNYSSWSFRPWLAMKASGIVFRETVAPFDEPNHNLHFLEFSPSKKVPALKHGDLTIWESLAIMEYVADLHPEANLWPSDIAERGKARAVAHEMHGGFGALRSECPMNMRRTVGAIEVSDQVRADVSRIEQIWDECLQASGGPFLYGSFTNADAMYGPVINRLEVYELSDADHVLAYGKTMKALPSWQEWDAASRAEPWVVEEEEV